MTIFPYIDIHTHQNRQEYHAAQVVNLFPGTDIPEFTSRNFFSVGLHPWEVTSEDENNARLRMVEEALDFDHVIFVGECGLDKVSNADIREQKRVFLAQAFLAEEFQKPLLVHCVRAYQELLELYKSCCPTVPWILHGYSGNQFITEQLLSKNFIFSFGRILFNEKSKAIVSFKDLPLSKIFLETDEFHGPIIQIYEKAAEIKGIEIEEIKKSIWINFNKLENIFFET